MKILVIADIEDRYLWDHFRPENVEGVDLILACGDLRAEYLEFLVTMVNVPVFYVPGNHDQRYDEHPPQGCTSIDGKVIEFGGLKIGGLGGAMKYKEASHMYTEAQQRRRARKLHRSIRRAGGLDILVTHAPVRGYGDMSDLAHQGYLCYGELLDRWQPRFLFHGHVHQEYDAGFRREQAHPSGCRIINGYRYLIIDVDTEADA